MNNDDLHWELSPWRTGCIVAAVLTSLMVGNGLTIDIEDATTRIVEHARNVAMTGTWIALGAVWLSAWTAGGKGHKHRVVRFRTTIEKDSAEPRIANSVSALCVMATLTGLFDAMT